MILTGPEIVAQLNKGRIRIEPFSPDQVNPNSYNFRLGDEVEIYESQTLDARKTNATTRIAIPDDGLLLQPDRLYLAPTVETIGSDHFVPIIHSRSSVARMGLFVHITADLIDIGSYDRWILQLHAVHPLRIYRGMPIGQVTFWRTSADRETAG